MSDAAPAKKGTFEIVTDRKFLAGTFRATNHEEIMRLCAPDLIRAAMPHCWTKSVGLAAPQVGIPIRFAIYQLNGQDEVWLVNPEIVNASGLVHFQGEGCLSIPDSWFNTWRYNRITVLNDVAGKRVPVELAGFEAFVAQHEIDHLDGILCFDRVKKPTPPGRNEPCPCGSGTKFKKCCGSGDPQPAA